MTWEETIKYIRTIPEFSELVEKAYFHENLLLNIENFKKSEEFLETLSIVNNYSPKAKTILDVGCGNGISAINFALKGFEVTAVEPDSSKTVGAGAIKIVKEKLNLKNLEVFEKFAEDINFPSNTFDVVYIRQAMHHANDLQKFIKECVRVLKPNGLLLTIRDHVIFNEDDKQWFLKEHPLHKYYGGENAFTAAEYRESIENAGATIKKELKFYDSVINFFPLTKTSILDLEKQQISKQKKKLYKKLDVFSKILFALQFYKKVSKFEPLNEALVPGRMYSYIAIKK